MKNIFYKRLLIFFLMMQNSLFADSVGVNLTCGYLVDQLGFVPPQRLAVNTLCVLVADLAGDGFDPPDQNWASGDDVLITVSDQEFSNGTQQFDLASGNTEPGLLSRSLAIDLAQFVGRSTPVPFALRWFPEYRNGDVKIAIDRPKAGARYGEFFRITPLYATAGGVAWHLPLRVGGLFSPDPFASSDAGGVDSPAAGSARWRVLRQGRAEELVLLGSSSIAKTLRFRGLPGRRYEVQRSADLLDWEVSVIQATDFFGAGEWTDLQPLNRRGFYRVVGPLL